MNEEATFFDTVLLRPLRRPLLWKVNFIQRRTSSAIQTEYFVAL